MKMSREEFERVSYRFGGRSREDDCYGVSTGGDHAAP
jgi:hypothetical protein